MSFLRARGVTRDTVLLPRAWAGRRQAGATRAASSVLLQVFLAVCVSTAAALAADTGLPLVTTLPSDQGSLATQPAVVVRRFHFIGNTRFTEAELAKVVAPWTGRSITSEELEEARRAVTRYYVDKGYINSGAVLPDQTINEGVVTFQVVEGKLSQIDVHGNRRLRTSYITSRLRRSAGPPLNIVNLKDRLELIRLDPNLKVINAELKPGGVPGESKLDVAVQETNPFQLGLQFSNRRAPSVGSTSLEVLASDLNLTGNGDALNLRYDVANGAIDDLRLAGARDYTVDYLLPLSPEETTLELNFTRTDSLVIEQPFNDLDINSDTQSLAVTLRQPVFRRPISDVGRRSLELALFVSGAYRENRTSLLGNSFSFSPGVNNGTSRVTVIRFGQELLTRSQSSAISLRSTFSFGVDAFDSTADVKGLPGGVFAAWLGQAQYVRRLGSTDAQLVIRGAAQFSDRSLLPLEQFALGGIETVRGYRENDVVSDDGVVGSIEVRVPIVRGKGGADVLDIVPFFDAGAGFNRTGSPKAVDLSSVGVGLIYTPNPHINAQLYYGKALEHPSHSSHDPQDLGIHFNLVFWAF